MKDYTEDHLMSELHERVEKSTQRAVASDLGISSQHLNDLLRGRRILSDRVALAMGYTREIIFRKRAA